MRIRFDEQLQQLNLELIRMGAYCEEAIQNVMAALEHDDMEKIALVHELEEEVDHKEREIESLCMKLLLQQQPVAKDLRVVSSALKMISDMERIGDQASDIADIIPYLIGKKMETRSLLQDMGEAVCRMVTASVDSFVQKDLSLAREVMTQDDVIDQYFADVKTRLIKLFRDKNSDGEMGVDVLMVSKYLERIGDHAVNIAEWVEYSITGEHVKK